MFVLGCGVILILLWIYSLGSTITNPGFQEDVVNDFQQFVPLEDNREIPEIW